MTDFKPKPKKQQIIIEIDEEKGQNAQALMNAIDRLLGKRLPDFQPAYEKMHLWEEY